MKILAVSVNYSGTGLAELKSGYAQIAKETESQYKMEASGGIYGVSGLINSRSIIRKDEVGKIVFDEGDWCRNQQRCNNISLKVWAVVEKEDRRLELVWRQQLKDAAVEEMKSRLRKATGLLRRVENLDVDEEE